MESQEDHECFHCGEEFSSATDLKIHLAMHTKNLVPSPAVVEKTDKEPGVVTETNKDQAEAGREPHECFHCGEEFSSATDFKQHLETHTKTATASSSTMDVIEPSLGVLDSTDKGPAIESGGDPHECFHCGEEFSSATDFKIHLESHSKTAAPSPAVVEKTDKEPGVVTETNKDQAEAGREPHECFHCGEEFSSATDFKIHLETHKKNAAPSPGVVETTDKETDVVTVADESLGDVTNVAELRGEPHECFHCGEEFSSATDFKQHLETHTKTATPSPAVVNETDKGLAVVAVTGNSADNVLDTAEPGGEPHECFHCGEEFSSAADFRIHLETHTKTAKPSSAVEHVIDKGPAGVAVTDNSADNVLDTAEPGGEPHECFHCGEEFSSATDFKQHLETHTKTVTPSPAVEDVIEQVQGVVAEIDKSPAMVEIADKSPQDVTNTTESCGEPQECFHCGEEFSSTADYTIHLETHKRTATPTQAVVNMTDKGPCVMTETDMDQGVTHKGPIIVSAQSLAIDNTPGKVLDVAEADGEIHECFHCGEEFSNATDFKVHLETHTKTSVPSSATEDVTAKSPVVVDVTGKDQGVFAVTDNNPGDMLDIAETDMDQGVTDKGPIIVSAKSLAAEHAIDNTPGKVLDVAEAGEEPHECFHCGEEFSSATDFKIHLETHTKIVKDKGPGVVTVTCDQGMADVRDKNPTIKNVSHKGQAVVAMTDNSPGDVLVIADPEPHECFHCGEEFSSPADYKVHLETHTKTITPSPVVVDMIEKGPSVMAMTDRAPAVIDVTVKNPGSVVNVIEPSREPHECFHCGKEFASGTEFKIHLETHTKTPTPSPAAVNIKEKGPGVMTVTDKSPRGVANMTDKIPGDMVDLTEPGGEPHECFHCGAGFYSIPDLDEHMKVHAKVKIETVKNIPIHDTGICVDLTSDGDDPHECFHCGEEFDSEDLLNSHLVTRHQVKPHRCVTCGDGFMHEHQLKAHELIHKGVSPKVLSDVQMMYKSYTDKSKPSTSSTHKQVHNNRQVQCTTCSKVLGTPYDLRRHLLTHTGEKPHACHLCPQKYQQTSQLYHHMRQIHREGPHVCSICGEGFQKKADLILHRNAHYKDESYKESNKKPYLSRSTEQGALYKCAQCGDSFNEKTDLDVHSQIHMRDAIEISPQMDSGVTHKCPRCSAIFGGEVDLNRHIMMCIPSSRDLGTQVNPPQPGGGNIKKEITGISNLNVTNQGVVDLTLDDEDDAEKKDEIDRYKCPSCDESFCLEVELNAHLIMFHSTPDSHECFHCGEEFDKEDTLKLHILTTHEKTELKHHHSMGELQAHKDSKHKKRNPTPTDATAYKCYCGMQFSSPDNLERHKETHSDVVDLTFDEDDTYKCSLCDDVYSREEELIVHMMTHPKQEPFECPECGKKFVFEKDYRFHLRTHVKAEGIKKNLSTHTGDKPHKCPVCPKRFASLAVLQRHEATHGSEPHKCQHCGAGFWQIYYLRRHLEKECSKLRQGTAQNGSLLRPSSLSSTVPKGPVIHTANSPNALSVNGSIVPHGAVLQAAPGTTPMKEETYTCCGWSFMSEADMKVHELSHKVTVYKCVHCKQVFRSPAELETHLKTHNESTRKRPYQDDSSNSSTLTAPSTSHMEEERHPCLTCGKEFRTEGFLNKHMLLHKAKVHKADVCHRCNECGQKFLSLAGLTRHALTHADNKPNQCPVCNENFNNSAKLFEHMATHDRGKTHSCPQCGKTFKRIASLKNHMRIHDDDYGDGLGEGPSENRDIPNIDAPYVPNIPRRNIREPNDAGPTHSRMDQSDVKLEEEAEDDDTGLMCTYCGKKFNQQKHLKAHYRTHMRSISNTYCETKVKYADADGKELRVVTRIRKKRNKCYLCFKMFRTRSDLTRHMMIHTGERPCKCAFCPAGFIQISHLKLHTIKHHRGKVIPPTPEEQIMMAKEANKVKSAKRKIAKYGNTQSGYLCCETRFMTCLEIQHHWLVHNEEKSYACPHCDMKFTKGYTRTKHIMYKHSGIKPNCLDCGKEFAQFKDLIAHMKVHEQQLDPAPPGVSTNRVEIYTDVADGEPASSSRAEVYTDVADTGYETVKAEVIPDDEEDPEEFPILPKLDNILHTAPDPLLLKKEAAQDSETDTDMEVDPADHEVHPVALKKEGSMNTTDDPSSPIDDAVLDSEPEEQFTSLKEEAMMDTDPEPAAPTNSSVPDTGPGVEPASPDMTIVASLPPVPALLNQYRCLHCGDRFSERGHLIPHVSNHSGRNYSSCNACKMGFLRKEELQVHLTTHFMYPS